MASQAKRLSHAQRFQLTQWLDTCLKEQRKFNNMTVVTTTAEKELKFPVSKQSIDYVIHQLEWNVRDFVTHRGMPSTKTTHKVNALEKKIVELSSNLEKVTTMLMMFMTDVHAVVETNLPREYLIQAENALKAKQDSVCEPPKEA